MEDRAKIESSICSFHFDNQGIAPLIMMSIVVHTVIITTAAMSLQILYFPEPGASSCVGDCNREGGVDGY